MIQTRCTIDRLGRYQSQSSIRPGDDSDISVVGTGNQAPYGRNPVFALEMIQTAQMRSIFRALHVAIQYSPWR